MDFGGWLCSAAVAVLISEIVLMLMPDGGMKSFARIASGVLIMTMIISPLQSCGGAEIKSGKKSTSSLSYSDIIMDVYNEAAKNNID